MRISRRVLQRFTALPTSDGELRTLLESVGLEVKRMDTGPDDTLIDLEILANRGDHYCYAGVARELHGRTGLGLNLPEGAALHLGEAPVPITLETPLCLRYSLTLLQETQAPGFLPEHLLRLMTAAGLSPVTPAVDITNIVSLELGQPTHLFDADSLKGGITVRASRPGETAWPLFAPGSVPLPPGTLVVADEEKILAVAGVIGCEESKARPDSRRLLLESACFDPVSVRQTSRALSLRTDSSIRFERGGDPDLVLKAAGRVVELLEAHAGATRLGATCLAGDWRDPQREIILEPAAVCRFLSLDLDAANIAERLERYGFTILPGPGLRIMVPPARLWDVEFPDDLVEELAKSVGYEAIPETAPAVPMGAAPSLREQVRAKVDDLLVGEGFFEVLTDSFHGFDLARKWDLPPGHPHADHVRVLDAAGKGYSHLKNNALLQLISGLGDNLRLKVEDIKIFEWNRTFQPDPAAENGLCQERPLLTLACVGHSRPPAWGDSPRMVDAWYCKGLVQELAMALSVPLEVDDPDPSLPLSPYLHPGRQAAVLLQGRPVGILGEVHPLLCARLGIKRARPCYLEIERTALETPPCPRIYQPPPDQPATIRCLALTLPGTLPAATILAVMRQAAPGWLAGIRVVDVFHHPSAADGMALRTLTYELAWSNAERTRTTEELNTATEELLRAVEQKFGSQGVVLRSAGTTPEMDGVHE